MNSTKVSILSSLHAVSYWEQKNPELANQIASFVKNIVESNIPSVVSVVSDLKNEGYINDQNKLTFKGELTLINDPRRYGPNHLGIQTNNHLRTSLNRNLLRTNNGRKGILSFLSNQEISSVLEAVLDEVFDRMSSKVPALDLLTEDSAAFMVEINDVVEKQLSVESNSTEIISNGVVKEVQQEQEPVVVETKKTAKKKTTKKVAVKV